MAKGRRGLDGRHRDKSGRIDRKHGNTRVASLRKEYGESFASGRRKDMMLKTLLKETGSASLNDYLRHHHRKRASGADGGAKAKKGAAGAARRPVEDFAQPKL